ncbi:MAG TPA: hypothetical protein VNZ67_08360, partial [bacterium]|nr:hypothetical protein [bacterium]
MGPRFAGAGEAWAARPFGARVLEFGLILSALAGLWVGVFAVLPGPGGVPLHLMTLGAFVGLASAMALAFSWALARRTAAWTRPRVPVLLAAQGLAWTWLLSQGSSQFAGDRALATALDLLALAWLLGGIACAKGWLVPQSSLQRVETLVLPGVLLPAGLALRLFPGYTPPPLGPVLGLAAAVLLGLAWLRPGPRRPWDRWDLAALALLWAAMVPVFLPYQTYSMDYYLGPLNGLWLGWHSWVQVGCQYGPGSVLFLEACFKALRCPPAWAAFSALHLLAFLAWFGALAWLLRSALRSRPLAWAGMAALLLGCYYQGTGMGNLPYPSTGPLRFGPPLLVVLACYARLRAQGRHWALDLLPWAALVVAAAWSLEVFVFALAGGLGMRLWECWGRPGWARRLGADLAVLAAALACWLAALSLGLRLHAGAWPDWAAYLQQVGAYGGGFGAVPLYRWSPWIFFPALAVASLAALIHRRVG